MVAVAVVATQADHLQEPAWNVDWVTRRTNPAAAQTMDSTTRRRNLMAAPMQDSNARDARVQTCVVPTTIFAITRDCRERCTLTQTICAPAINSALNVNPDLTFGNYVAATRLGQNLGSRRPNITRDAILSGLASGRSMGRTLQDLGLSERESKDARRRVDDEIKKAKKN